MSVRKEFINGVHNTIFEFYIDKVPVSLAGTYLEQYYTMPYYQLFSMHKYVITSIQSVASNFLSIAKLIRLPRNGQVISSHILLGMWLLIHAGIDVNRC